MYRYDDYDHQLVAERVRQYAGQVERRLSGELTEDEFRILRLQNGLYMQRHAYMLRIAIPYGMLSSAQLRVLARIAREYDRGYGHFTTRQNIQFNWMALERTPAILQMLAEVEMHAIQTSGNCIRNTTTDQFAGIDPDEVADPRPFAELIRQWSTFHPEFAYLPRKFKIAISGGPGDRAATAVHDIGLHVVCSATGEVGFRVLAGGGLGRTPVIGSVIREFLPAEHLLSYLEAILRVYNLHGRRDNIYKARIKILVRALGAEEFARQVEAEWQHLRGGPATLTPDEIARALSFFPAPSYDSNETMLAVEHAALLQARAAEKAFDVWCGRNVHPHRRDGYAAVTVSLKKTGVPPGDIQADQMDLVAELADRFSFGELRVTHEQNLVLADVRNADLHALWSRLREHGLATPNIGLLTDIICCPGGDFCALANAKSIPVAESIARHLDDLDYLHDVGDIELNISGCINACGHHHVGNIGILGVDKDGAEFYQVSLGGSQGKAGSETSIGKIIGPSFSAPQMPEVIERLVGVYLAQRTESESFIDTVRRLGVAPFKERVYGTPLAAQISVVNGTA